MTTRSDCRCSRFARLVFTLMMTLAWCGAVSPAAAQPAAPPVPNPAALKELQSRMARSFDALGALAREMPRDTFDPQAVIEIVGRRPEKLFEWVRDNTFWVPYRGALRGPSGVLMDRVGSSLDRSLLLAALLRDAGVNVRLAHANLDDAQSKAFAAAVRPVPADAVPKEDATDAVLDKRLDDYAARFGLNTKTIRESMKLVETDSDRRAAEAAARVAVQARALAGAVGDPGKAAVAANDAAARDHWWVQVEQDGSWTDYDPSNPDAAPGKALAAAQETVRPEELDPKLSHTLRLRVLVEQWDNGAVAENVVLDHRLRPGDLFGADVKLAHNPLTWPTSLDLSKEKDPDAALKRVVGEQLEWLPVLWVGGVAIMQSSFTVEGDVNSNPRPNPAAQLGNAAGGLFGGGALGGGGDAKAGGKRLTAEWIEYTIEAPGREPKTIRRQVFDLLGPAARGSKPVAAPVLAADAAKVKFGLALIGQTEILPQVCRLSPRYVEARALRATLDSREAMNGIIEAALGQGSPDADPAADLEYVSGELYALAMARNDWSKHRGDIYLDQINVLTYHTQMSEAEGGALIACQGYDIVANDVAIRPGSAGNPFLVRLEQGVLETNAEAVLMDACGRDRNTASLFTKLAGKEWVTVRDAQDGAWKQLQLPADIKARVEQDLAAGQVVIVPNRVLPDGQIAWWRIDPTTGQTLGIGDRGWGQSMTENIVQNVRIVVNLLDMLLCLRAVSGSNASNGVKGAGIVTCIVKGTVKHTGFLVKGPSKMGAGLIIDLFGDFAGTLGGYALKEVAK